jgi:Glyoxalase-like domain
MAELSEEKRGETLGGSRGTEGRHWPGRCLSWVVMADPEGNEFCVLTPRKK